MGEKIVVGPVNRGLKNDRVPFVIDNDSFPTLINAYQWRGRIKRKRGTEFLGRLTRYFNSTSPSYNPGAFLSVPTFSQTIILDGFGKGNILSSVPSSSGFPLEANGNIIPGSVTITIGVNIYTDPTEDGYLTPTGIGGNNIINYSTGEITIPAEAGMSASAIFRYYPDLPVLGIEEFIRSTNAFPGTIAFDKTYSYNINTTEPYDIYDVSFYKNLSTGTYAGYTQKINWSSLTWNGQDYQQFWTVNYQGALWATNGINIPFSTTNIGMQYQIPTATSGTADPTVVTFTINNCPLVIGDFVFANEYTSVPQSNADKLNFQTGYVTSVVTVGIVSTVTVKFPNANIPNIAFTPGILQYLTNRSDSTKDCIRWYDGDPTDGNATNPSFSPGKGWVNFCPPLSQEDFSIADLPTGKYYLVGSRIIWPFKDRLLFIGPVIQKSGGNPIYLQDTVIYSQNGTPYYTCSFSGSIFSPTTPPGFVPILVPTNQTATPSTFWEDQTGFGGFITAGLDTPITTVSSNEDVLIMGFEGNIQSKFVYTGNDIIPFNFFIINSELGSSSTFSAINMDKGVITRGHRGFIITSQVEALRMDMEIPDQVFEISLINNGTERVCAQRDFINEWIYFSYLKNQNTHKFPNQTLQYNYRDNSWAIFNESYTTYGPFRRQTGFTWATVGNIYKSWTEWNDPWDAGESTLLQPEVLGGNQQGFVLVRAKGTGEGNSLYIRSFSSSVVTSPDHCLNENDYIFINGCLGNIGTQVNGKIFSVTNVTQNTFTLNPSITSDSYLGGGVIQRLYVPFIQTKQFPAAWGLSRKTRLGVQQYLLNKTSNAQITLLIFLSQNGSDPYNDGDVFPTIGADNDSLIYSTILYTCPESINLGLTPANVNLQTPTANQQEQLWHRVNTSLIGDTIQIGFTLSDMQMRTITNTGKFISQDAEIEIHGFILDVTPSQLLV